MSQVIIVSNRLPLRVEKQGGELVFQPSLGGLATGLSSYVGDRNNIWIGWPGIASDELNDAEKEAVADELAKHSYMPVWLTQRQIDDFYNGYSNSVLWPLFHSLRQRQRHNRTDRQRWWKSYREVNQLFAEAVLTVAESSSRIWVHDYQLLLVPEMLRAGRADLVTGFFLHIPFPDTRTYSKLPEAKKLLAGMLGANVIGFHTTGYVANFERNCLQANLEFRADDTLVLQDHVVRVGDFPMGIDFEKYAGAGRDRAVKAAVRKYRSRYKHRRVIVAVDRLDPSKGLVERLEAYRMFLELQPKLRGKIVFSMVAAPSRTSVPAYRELARRLKRLVNDINNTYGTSSWQPVDYIHKSIPFEDVSALFAIADVAFIAPIRDGMNLAAKEFIASNRKSGVLILSETAGAAQELPDAILVNPKRPEELVDALQQALTMRRRELRNRLRRMREQLSRHTVQNWAKDFISVLQQPVPGTPNITRSLRERFKRRLIADYKLASRRLLLLDYDGSLVPFKEDFQAAAPNTQLIDTLTKLSSNARNDVVIISGRSAKNLQEWFGHLPVSLVAEHGASIKAAGHKRWQVIEHTDTAWKKSIKPTLDKYTSLTPKARLETKPHSLVWHYRAAPPYYAQKYAVVIKRVLKRPLKEHGLEILQGNKVIEIKNPQVAKGKAAERWLKRTYDFIIAIGDDMTDEDLFRVLSPTAYSVKVGRGRTQALYRLGSYRDVLSLLHKLIKA